MNEAFFRFSLPLLAAALWLASCAPLAGNDEMSSGPPPVSQRHVPRAAKLRALNLSPSGVTGGETVSGTVVLSAAAPAGGITIHLSVDDPAVSVPATVRIAEGATSADFSVTTSPINATTTAMITGNYEDVNKSVGLAVRRPELSSMSLNPTALAGGSTSTGTLRLNGKAPLGGIVVRLSSDMPSRARVPSSATVAAGSDSATFVVSTSAGDQAPATISASTEGVTKTAALTIQRKKPQLSATPTVKRAATNEQNKPRVPPTY